MTNFGKAVEIKWMEWFSHVDDLNQLQDLFCNVAKKTNKMICFSGGKEPIGGA